MVEILISSSVLILVLAILRLILRDKISARLQYALWLLVLVRLLVPVSFFQSPVSVAEAAAPVTERVEYISGAILSTGPIYPSEQTLSEITSLDVPDQAIIPVFTLVYSARVIWYVGMAVMAAWFLIVNVRLARRLKKNRTPYDATAKLPVYVASELPSPCLFGLLRPSIYLTERAAEDDTRARQIIAHELTHYRHGDMIWTLLRSVCLVVWWFNPFVWLAAALSRQDCELACDEGTIKALGEDSRFDYGRTLVGMAKVGVRPSDLLCGATTMTTGRKSLRERVARIANAPKMSATAAIIVLLIAAGAVGCTYGGAAATADAPAEPEVPLEVSPSASATDAESDPAAEELIAYYLRYLREGAGAADFETWAEFIYFPGDYNRELAEDNYFPVYQTRMLANEVLSADLAAFLVSCQDFEDGPEFGSLQFVGRYEGRLYVFRNKLNLPEELRSGLEDLTLPDPAEENMDIMVVDPFYQEEVARELGGFAVSDDVELILSEDFPADDTAVPMTPADLVYGTDSWQFTYNGEPIANEPLAVIKIRDAEGRTLWIMDDADALMIQEADGSVTWADYSGVPVDCGDVIRRLLPWAKGEYVDPAVLEAELEEQQRIADELGIYGLRDMEPFYAGAYTTDYVPGGGEKFAPPWAQGGEEAVFGQCVYFQYGEEPSFTELAYTRYYQDQERTIEDSGAAFRRESAYYEENPSLPFKGGLTVHGCEAFLSDDHLIWYDADLGLIFRLWGTTLSEEGLLALAETVYQ